MKKEKGFTYEVILHNDKKYIGAKVGTPDEHPNYYGSAKDESEYFEDMKIHGVKSHKIIFQGTAQEAFNFEKKLLTEADAKNNDKYYNKTNGGGYHAKSTDMSAVYKLFHKINNLEFEIKQVKKQELEKFIELQIRLENLNSKKVNLINEQMYIDMKLYGYLPPPTKSNPQSYIVHVLENYKEVGGIINGIHTNKAGKRNKLVSEIPTMKIPESEWSVLSPEELDYLGALLNPQNKFVAEPTSDEYWIGKLRDKKNDKGIEYRSEENKELLTKAGFNPTQMDRRIFRKLEENEKDENITPSGMQSINYDVEPHITTLNQKLNSLNTLTTVAVSITSGNYTLDRVLDRIDLQLKQRGEKADKVSRIVVLMTHPKHTSYVEWHDGKLTDKGPKEPLLTLRKSRLKDHFTGIKNYMIEFKDMDHLQEKF